jgi:hypothetical protein
MSGAGAGRGGVAAADPLAGLSKTQKAGVDQVKDFTSCSDAQAVMLLKAVGWQVNLACDRFFNSGSEGGARAPANASAQGAIAISLFRARGARCPLLP